MRLPIMVHAEPQPVFTDLAGLIRAVSLDASDSLYMGHQQISNPEDSRVPRNEWLVTISRITEHVWLGKPVSEEVLRARGITKVVCLINHQHDYSSEIEVLHDVWLDAPQFPIASHLEPVLAQLIDWIRAGHNVYVHCQMGASRSVAVVVAYLMCAFGLSFSQAEAVVYQRRKHIRMNLGFTLYLMTTFDKPV